MLINSWKLLGISYFWTMDHKKKIIRKAVDNFFHGDKVTHKLIRLSIENYIREYLTSKNELSENTNEEVDFNISNYCIDTNKSKGTFYFKFQQNGTFKYIPQFHDKEDCITISVSAIHNAYDSANTADSSDKIVQFILYLYKYNPTPKELEVLKGYIKFTDIQQEILDEVKNINSAESRGLVLAKMVYLLNNFNPDKKSKLTIITNDLNFFLNLIPSFFSYLNHGNELWVLYDPASVSDLISFKLYMLKKMGAILKILPVNNKYPYYGIVPDWTPEDTNITPSEFYNFKTFFFERGLGNNYFNAVSDERERETIIKLIRKYDDGVEGFRPKIFKSETHIEYNVIDEEAYIDFLNKSITFYDGKMKELTEKDNRPRNIVYLNVTFKFDTIDFTQIYYRSKNVTYHKVFQADRFIKRYTNKLYFFDETTNTVTIKAADIGIANQIFPINPPFLEDNKHEHRFEVAEGHSRLWVLYNMYNVRKIRTVVVSNIQDKYFEPSKIKHHSTSLHHQKFDSHYSNKWGEADFKLELRDEHEVDIPLDSRNIEIMTHYTNDEIFLELFDLYVSEGLLTEYDRAFSPRRLKLNE